MTEFMAAVDYDSLERFQQRLQMVARSHVGQGIKPWMYAVFVETLVHTICFCVGPDVPYAVQDAWTNLAAFSLRGMLPEVLKEKDERADGLHISSISNSERREQAGKDSIRSDEKHSEAASDT